MSITQNALNDKLNDSAQFRETKYLKPIILAYLEIFISYAEFL